jgi:hypothetical protein
MISPSKKANHKLERGWLALIDIAVLNGFFLRYGLRLQRSKSLFVVGER